MKNQNKNTIVQRTMTVCCELHLREVGEGEPQSRVIEGYAILFNVPSVPLYEDEDVTVREMIAPEAATKEFLDGCDIKLTMFHDRQLILGRSKEGQGTLSYGVDEKGVKFECECPKTADGDKAIELVKRGDLAGCSFMFSTRYYDESCVEHRVERVNNHTVETYIVRVMTGVYDFTLAADPAYPDTSVEAREFIESVRPEPAPEPKQNNYREQVSAMRKAARQFNQ